MFIRYAMAMAALVALPSLPVVAQSEISDADREALVGAIKRGQAIYRYDQAAWHTTDAMLEQVSDPQGEGIRGWIINEVEGGLEAVFFRSTDDDFEAVWSGVYDGEAVTKMVTYESGERGLSEAETAKARASKVPLDEEMQRCSSKPFNTVVLPTGKDDGSLFVYYLVPQESLDEVPLGGHYRFEVRDDKVVDSRAFTNSCISLPTGANDEGNKPAGLTISHLLDPVPTEIHVFSTYAARIPIYVITSQNERIWVSEVSGGESRIRLIER